MFKTDKTLQDLFDKCDPIATYTILQQNPRPIDVPVTACCINFAIDQQDDFAFALIDEYLNGIEKGLEISAAIAAEAAKWPSAEFYKLTYTTQYDDDTVLVLFGTYGNIKRFLTSAPQASHIREDAVDS